ncbi:MAG: D-glycero-alpha-D-manno-heptose-1,7-bisphosphate 7-phosphatase [Humibacter sp.]
MHHPDASTVWCLFLDRDGVINTRMMDDYVRSWADFHFEPGALQALVSLARWAPRIVIVTNQQGVGKGLMSLAELDEIHSHMRRAIIEAGGRIDAVQFCPHLATDDCACRKPRPGMATDYLDTHPEVDGSASVLVGDTPSDIAMARRLGEITGGCVAVRIDAENDPSADATFPSLAAFAASVARVTHSEE